MKRSREWDGRGVWSSHPCPNPVAQNLRAFTEILAMMSWDERLARAYRRAIKDYHKAGGPSIPLGSTDYRKQFSPTEDTKP